MIERPFIKELSSQIEALEIDSSLQDEKNFQRRYEAIDFIDFHILDYLESILSGAYNRDEWHLLQNRAEKIKHELEGIDNKLFQNLRKGIKDKKYRGEEFHNLISEYTRFNEYKESSQIGYDILDAFINGLFHTGEMPEQSKELEPEMVFYQKTPVRIIFELAGKCNFASSDVFFDLGSGLGQVPMLVNLLTGIKSIGIEFEPAFCEYSMNCAKELGLSDVHFINTDARKADYSGGNVFFMYTPFEGDMLKEVLEMLLKESLERGIRIITYGPCSSVVATESWLIPESDTGSINPYELYIFRSR